ncbi:MAG: SMC-Scp complex subunit ScpB [Hyphomicrobiales bacterium]
MSETLVPSETGEPQREEKRPASNVTMHPRADKAYQMRVVEALLFAASEPVSEAQLLECLADGTDLDPLLEELHVHYAERGVNLRQIAGKWTFRTAEDLSFLLRREAVEQKKLSQAALETLSIIAYHQPVTRNEIEDVRGVSTSKGTLDILMEMGWVKLRGRRRVPGRPVTYGTTDDFLSHFGLDSVKELPGMTELKGAGLLSSTLPADFEVPVPAEDDELAGDEDPLEEDIFEDEPPLEMHLPEDLDSAKP